MLFCFFFFQAEDGIRDLVRSRGLGDVYKRQSIYWIYRYVPSINRSPTIKTEYQMYPLLKDIFKSNFNFEFDPDIKGIGSDQGTVLESNGFWFIIPV